MLYIVTLPSGFFGRAEQGWKSLNVKRIKNIIERAGREVTLVSFEKALEVNRGPEDIFLFTSSDEPTVRQYIKDIVYILSLDSKVIPQYPALLAHENKGFQQLWRDYKGFGDLEGGYLISKSSLPKSMPFVFKPTTGAGSSGVVLINSKKKKKRIEKEYFSVSIYRRFIKFLRKFTLSATDLREYLVRHQGYFSSVWQKFIPDLSNDFKVIILGNKFYVLKRSVRKNDFRASGSGIFSYEEVDCELLNYALEVFKALDVPFASLDIVFSNGKYHLIEYQCLHFGPYTVNKSAGYYSLNDKGNWEYKAAKPDLDQSIADSVIYYLSGS